MSNVATIPPRPRSITMDMADRYGMDHVAFERTLRGTVFPPNAPPEQFAAFLLVAKEYGLNPVTKEIYAFPARGGGIVPVVSIDGWMNIINSNPQFDGMDFEEKHDEEGKLVAIKCTIYRKDRSHPVSVTEYLDECVRQTDPWKMKHRMLRHKAAIQCARYAFGLAGIYDEDEAEKIANAPKSAAMVVVPPPPPPPPAIGSPQEATADDAIDPEALIKLYREHAANAKDSQELQDLWERHCEPKWDLIASPDQDELLHIHRTRERELEP